MIGFPQTRRKFAKPLATGQTTQYSSELDDGYYHKGIVKAYVTSGSSTTNVYLAHYAGTDIAFVKGAPDTITSVTIDFTTLFKAADVINIAGSSASGNNADWTIANAGVAAHTITLTSSNLLTSVGAGDSITISKREALSNIVVFDVNTGLMWTQTNSKKMGATSAGTMPWTGQLYDIFAWCAAVNTASVGGYSDWRVPNANELTTILDCEAPNGWPNATAFPSLSTTTSYWTSTTVAGATTYAVHLDFVNGFQYRTAKNGLNFVLLVRG
jgi:hypothetical protein